VSKDREFNNILDECLERLLTSGETVEQCLERYPEHAAELEPLLRTAMVTRETLTIEPNAEFRARARYQLRSEMEKTAVRRWRPILTWQPRWVMVTVVVMVVLLAGSGTVVAADSSMPGTPLYGVKLATENVRLTLSSSDVARAELYAALADRRIAEIAYAIEKGKLKQVDKVTKRLNNHLAMMSRLSLAAEKVEGKDPAPAQDKATEEKPISETAPQKSAGKQPSSATARPTVAAEDSRGLSARAMSEAAARIKERAKLRILLGQYAVNHPERLRALLEQAPESARPAILQAIAISVTSYKKILEELNNQSDNSPADEDTRQDQSDDSPANGDSSQDQSGDSPTSNRIRRDQPNKPVSDSGVYY